MVYSNSGSVNPFIIIESNNRQLPVMNSDVAEAPGSLERGDRGATVTTNVAGAEHKTRTGHQYIQISRTHLEPIPEEVEETSRECSGRLVTTAHEARHPGTSEEDPDEQDSFTKLLAEMNLEIEEEADIEFEGEAGSVADISEIQEDSDYCRVFSESIAEVLLNKEYDVRTDHPTSVLGEEVPLTRFRSAKQEVPESVAELEPEGLTMGSVVPVTDLASSTRSEREEEILYNDVMTPASESALTVDNKEFQRLVNLQEVFSFHALEEDDGETLLVSPSITIGCILGTTAQDTSAGITAQDTTYEMVTNETFPTYNNDVADALSHSGNEFIVTPGNEFGNQLQTGRRERYFQLGRGDYPPTAENRKENSEEKTYFHPVRLPCQSVKQKEDGDVHLSTESRLSSPRQQEAVSSHGEKNAGRRPTKRIGTTLSATVRPAGYQNSRQQKFNQQFGYKTRKHPISCHQSDIRRWIPSDNIKECRTFQHPTGSSNGCSRGANPESYALHIEQLSSTGSSTGAQHQKQQSCHLMLDTLLDDSQKDITCDSAAIDNDDGHQERRPPLAADDRRELPNDQCLPLFGHDDKCHYARAELPPAWLETDKRACRYSNDHHDVA